MDLAFSIIAVMAVFVIGAVIAFEIALISKDEEEDNTKRPKDYDDD